MRVASVATSAAFPELPLASAQNLTVSASWNLLRIARIGLEQNRGEMFGVAPATIPFRPMEDLKKLIREVPDYPKPGILFYDITTLLKDKCGFRAVIDGLKYHYRDAPMAKR